MDGFKFHKISRVALEGESLIIGDEPKTYYTYPKVTPHFFIYYPSYGEVLTASSLDPEKEKYYAIYEAIWDNNEEKYTVENIHRVDNTLMTWLKNAINN